jgi:hypothetical protein
MENLDQFVNRILQAIPCYLQPRTSKIGLKKYDTNNKNQMGLFAVVTEQKTRFHINAKCWLASDECKTIGKLGRWGHGKQPNGCVLPSLIFYVEKGSTGQDYRDAVRCLTIIRNNL